MNGYSSDVRDAIIAWAEATPRIRRVWIFGSRVKGGYRPDSDLDIAVEAEPVPDSEEALVVWMNQSENWKAQLQQKVSLAVDLDWFDPDGSTPRIYSALEEAKDLVYERALV